MMKRRFRLHCCLTADTVGRLFSAYAAGFVASCDRLLNEFKVLNYIVHVNFDLNEVVTIRAPDLGLFEPSNQSSKLSLHCAAHEHLHSLTRLGSVSPAKAEAWVE